MWTEDGKSNTAPPWKTKEKEQKMTAPRKRWRWLFEWFQLQALKVLWKFYNFFIFRSTAIWHVLLDPFSLKILCYHQLSTSQTKSILKTKASKEHPISEERNSRLVELKNIHRMDDMQIPLRHYEIQTSTADPFLLIRPSSLFSDTNNHDRF